MLSEDFYVNLDKNNNCVGIEIWKSPKTQSNPSQKTLQPKYKQLYKNTP
jgi:uncharacterized protein YuzE